MKAIKAHDDVRLEPFGPAHLDGAFALSSAARWPHRREDWEMVLGLSRGVVAVNGAGRVVGTTFMTPHGTCCATLNMVIVDEALRGRGLGRSLMTAAMAEAGGRSLRLTATPDGEPLYRKLGFREDGTVQQRQGVVVAATLSEKAVEPAGAADLPTMTTLDAAAYGARREALLAALWRLGQAVVVRRAGKVAGFAFLRPFGRGEAVGPVVAASKADAQALILSLAHPRAGRFLRLDLADCTGLEAWLDGLGLVCVDRGTLMRTTAATDDGSLHTGVPSSKVPGCEPRTFALASQALG